MITIILVIHLMLALALIVAVLLQRSEGGALGIGGGGGGGGGGFGLMSARGTTNLLTRATAVLAACFIATSLFLAILAGGTREPISILDQPISEQSHQPAVPLSQ
jgi:preprotein translocase subunit SecG